jgi:hypothetical protein
MHGSPMNLTKKLERLDDLPRTGLRSPQTKRVRRSEMSKSVIFLTSLQMLSKTFLSSAAGFLASNLNMIGNLLVIHRM